MRERRHKRDVAHPCGRLGSLVLETVRLFLQHPRDLPTERRAKAEARDRLEEETLGRIEDPNDRAAFADMLTRVTASVPLEESHAYHIDYPGLQATREALLALERMVWLRLEMCSAFSGEPIMVRRLEIPPWDEVP